MEYFKPHPTSYSEEYLDMMGGRVSVVNTTGEETLVLEESLQEEEQEQRREQ